MLLTFRGKNSTDPLLSCKPDWVSPRVSNLLVEAGNRMLDHFTFDYCRPSDIKQEYRPKSAEFRATWRDFLNNNGGYHELHLKALDAPGDIFISHVVHGKDLLHPKKEIIRLQRLSVQKLEQEILSYPSYESRLDDLLNTIRLGQIP